MTTPLYEVQINRADGAPTTLGEHAGKVVLVVNVASACGLTPQYKALEAVYERYRDRALRGGGLPVQRLRCARTRDRRGDSRVLYDEVPKATMFRQTDQQWRRAKPRKSCS